MSRRPIPMLTVASALGVLIAVSPITVTPHGSLAVGTALAANAGNGGGHGNGGARGSGGTHGNSAAGSKIAGHDSAAPGGGRGKSLGRLQNDHDFDDLH
jgi:hypothetical protein